MKSLSRVRLLATPWTAAYQAPPSMGFSRQEYWSGVPLLSLRYRYIYICEWEKEVPLLKSHQRQPLAGSQKTWLLHIGLSQASHATSVSCFFSLSLWLSLSDGESDLYPASQDSSKGLMRVHVEGLWLQENAHAKVKWLWGWSGHLPQASMWAACSWCWACSREDPGEAGWRPKQ